MYFSPIITTINISKGNLLLVKMTHNDRKFMKKFGICFNICNEFVQNVYVCTYNADIKIQIKFSFRCC